MSNKFDGLINPNLYEFIKREARNWENKNKRHF